jgi:hypothetical protein
MATLKIDELKNDSLTDLKLSDMNQVIGGRKSLLNIKFPDITTQVNVGLAGALGLGSGNVSAYVSGYNLKW